MWGARSRLFALMVLVLRWTARRLRLAAFAIFVMVFVIGVSSCGGSGPTISTEEVLLVPSANAGWAGWCIVRAHGGEGCGAVIRAAYPILGETWSGHSTPATTEGYVLTTEQVAAVSVGGGAPVSTYGLTSPSGLRGVVVRIHGRELLREVARGSRAPRFTPLDARGRAIRESAGRSARLGFEVPTRSLRNRAYLVTGVCTGQAPCLRESPQGARGSGGACTIGERGLAGLVVDGGSVVAPIRPMRGLPGRALLTCASTSYTMENWPTIAGVLIDARHPGVKPAPLPELTPLAGHPGVFQAASAEGPVVARRIPGAWVVVAKGGTGQDGLQRRLAVLEHLGAIYTAIGWR
jgi:hypothetical protein